MSTLQFVILLVVIFISTDGPTHVTSYVRKIRTWLFKMQTEKIRKKLERHGKIFSINRGGDFQALCFSEDFCAEPASRSGHLKTINPTFVFSSRDKKTEEFHKERLKEITTNFLWELCGKKYPKKYFTSRLVDSVYQNEKGLYVPSWEIDLEDNLRMLQGRMDQYIRNNR